MSISLGSSAASGDAFTFTPTGKPLSAFEFDRARPSRKASWAKWGLQPSTRAASFRVGGRRVAPDTLAREGGAFLLDLFNDAAVRAVIVPVDGRGAPAPLAGAATRVAFEALRVTAASLALFDPFVAAGVITGAGDGAGVDDEEEEGGGSGGGGRLRGYIRRKADEDVEGVTVSDLLRDSLVNPSAEFPVDDLLEPDGAQRELLFRVFRWVVVGGGACQPEEAWGAYLDAARAVYRDLARAVRDDAEPGGVVIATEAAAVQALEGGPQLFPRASPHNVCLVALDAGRATVTVLYCAFVPFW